MLNIKHERVARVTKLIHSFNDMKTLLWIWLCLGPMLVMAQEKAYDIALSYGAYTSPSFNQHSHRDYFSADFEYHLSKRWTVSSGLMMGYFNYYDNTRSNNPGGVIFNRDNTNARATELHGYAMAKYSLINSKQFTLQVGVGAGFFNQSLEYPYQDAQGGGIRYTSFTDLAFPLSLEAFYLFSNRLGVGLKAGGYIEPDFPLVGTHIGPQLRLRL